jgi:phosphoribosylformylglycinamidine cyclo-ligase
MAKACKAAGCALVGGETAEMPGMYEKDDFDLAGFVVGAVEKKDMLDTSTVIKGDLLLGLPSSGLHTNGFSLVRQILELDRDPSVLREVYPELGRSLGEELLEPHRSYYPLVEPVIGMVKGMAHITGGGLIENVPRALPEGLGAQLDTKSWQVPTIFTILQEKGAVALEEMYRVYNMGLGLVLVCDAARKEEILSLLPESRVVGEVTELNGGRQVML